jgi:hypothetical protein
MRRMSALVVAVLTAACLSTPSAEAVGTGDPTIESPTASTKLYAGFTGPFVVNLSTAPIGTYTYFVDKIPTGGGSPVQVGSTHQYEFNGSFEKPELMVPALSPGTGYAFHITYTDADMVVHQATQAFTISSDPAPRCSIVLPSQIRMAARSYLIRATLSAQCKTLHTTYASWQARDPKNFFAETFTFAGVRSDSWRIYDDERTGLYKVRPNSAMNSSNKSVLQNSTQLTMKMDSWVSLTSSRSGAFVTLKTTSTRYSPVANRFKAWAQRKVVLAYRTCSTCAWHRLKVQTTNSHGATSYRFRATAIRQYRATAAGTTTVWAPHPDYVRR